jgi:hypothetical protein
MQIRFFFLFVLLLSLVTGCYSMRSSSGGGQTSFTSRTTDAADVALPSGYKIEIVTENLTLPTVIALRKAMNVKLGGWRPFENEHA